MNFKQTETLRTYFHSKQKDNNMTGKERRKQIRRLAITEGNLSAREIAERFGVSRMTIHRDFKLLEESKQIKCIHGGAVPVRPVSITTGQCTCSSCNEPTLPHQRYLLEKPDHRQEIFCCACCGLKNQLQQDPSGDVYATDMISGKALLAKDAFFLIRSSAEPCCQPSILTFAGELEAATFRSSFGGMLARMTETLEFLRTEQTLKQSD